MYERNRLTRVKKNYRVAVTGGGLGSVFLEGFVKGGKRGRQTVLKTRNGISRSVAVKCSGLSWEVYFTGKRSVCFVF